MERHHIELEAHRLNVVAIAQGEPYHAQRYCGRLAPHLDCLMDDSTAPYFTYGIGRAGLKAVSLDTAKRLFDLVKQGIRGGQIVGDPLIMPASFIIDRQGIIRFAFYAEELHQHADLAKVLAAAQTLGT